MRLEKEKMIVRERELEDRINRLLEEKEKLNKAYTKISKQSYTAHYILQKERLVTQSRQINILTQELDELKVDKDILIGEIGEGKASELLQSSRSEYKG